MSELHPFTLYFVRLPGKPGWTPGVLTVAPENAERSIVELHPSASERRLVAQGMRTRTYGPDAPDDKYGELEHALAQGWWYDTRQQCWLAPEETAVVPVEKPLPAAMRLQTDEPCNGWWFWHLTFSPLVSNDAAIWTHLFGVGRVDYDIDFSGALERDPIAGLTDFAVALQSDAAARLVIDEEGGFTGLLAWHVEPDRIHLRLMSLCRAEDRKYDFLLAKDTFLAAIEQSVETFLAQGGWAAAD